MASRGSDVTATAEHRRHGAPHSGRRAVTLLQTVRPVLLTLAAVDTEPATRRIHPTTTVVGAACTSITPFQATAFMATRPAIGIKPRRGTTRASPDHVRRCYLIRNVEQDAVIRIEQLVNIGVRSDREHWATEWTSCNHTSQLVLYVLLYVELGDNACLTLLLYIDL